MSTRSTRSSQTNGGTSRSQSSGGKRKESTSSAPSKKLTSEQEQEVREAFELFDTDGTMTIQSKELKTAMRALGFDPEESEVRTLTQMADPKNTGKIEFQDFLNVVGKKYSERNIKDDLLQAFKFFDDEDTGQITLKDLKRVAKELGERYTEEELQAMIDEADADKDGGVTLEEFLQVMKRAMLY